MHGEFGRLPAGHGGVALHANVVNSGSEVIGIGGGIVIRLMAGETFGRHVGIIARNMTLAAVIERMTLGQGKAVWSKIAGFHPGMVVWHSMHTLSIPAERWLGLVVAL